MSQNQRRYECYYSPFHIANIVIYTSHTRFSLIFDALIPMIQRFVIKLLCHFGSLISLFSCIFPPFSVVLGTFESIILHDFVTPNVTPLSTFRFCSVTPNVTPSVTPLCFLPQLEGCSPRHVPSHFRGSKRACSNASQGNSVTTQ